MRATNLALVCGIVLGLSARAQAGPRETALEIVDKAIKAHGGADGLTKAQTATRTGSGTVSLGTANLPFTAQETRGLPGRFRIESTLDKSQRVISVLNADRGWRSSNGMSVELSKDLLQELQEEAYLEWIGTLVPLKKEGFDLTPVDGKMVNDKPTQAVQVSRKGHYDAKLYFDKDSGLLVKVERKSREAGLLLDKEYVFGDFKEFDGVKMPTKRTELLAGKKLTEMTFSAYQFPTRVDETAFTRP